MSYTPPVGNAANFTAAGYTPPSSVGVKARFPVASYSIPVPSSVPFKFVAEYSAPTGSAGNFTVLATTEFIGFGAVSVQITAAGVGEYRERLVVGDGTATVVGLASGVGAVGVAGNGAVTAPAGTGAGAGVRGVAGQGAVTFSNVSVTSAGVVERYELKGDVRLSGVLVNRRVRAYRRDSGALINEGDTVGGHFRLHTGFVSGEYYVIPIDLAEEASDWTPPCANRLVSVLAMDA